jgi:hypothetical protein
LKRAKWMKQRRTEREEELVADQLKEEVEV